MHWLIETYGVFADLPITGSEAFANSFAISTVQFPPAFTGTNTLDGAFDPVYPPRLDLFDSRRCFSFDGAYGTYMGDYDTAVADDQHIYYTWRDNRRLCTNQGVTRSQPDVRFIRISWPP